MSVHGGLTSPNKAQEGRGTNLVLHGGADPIVPVADVQALMAEWLAVDGPIEFVSYPGALHAFTNPSAAERHATYRWLITMPMRPSRLAKLLGNDFLWPRCDLVPRHHKS